MINTAILMSLFCVFFLVVIWLHKNIDKKKFKAVESKGYDPAKYGHKNPYSTRKLDNRTARGNAKRKRQTAGGVWGNDDEEEEDDSYNDDNNEFCFVFCFVLFYTF